MIFVGFIRRLLIGNAQKQLSPPLSKTFLFEKHLTTLNQGLMRLNAMVCEFGRSRFTP
jgi:hypothetical protein